MILSAEHLRLIRAGKKTQHRIPVIEPRSRRPGDHPGFGNQPHVGQRIPVSVRQLVDGHLRAVPQTTIIVATYQQATLADSLNPKAVQAEGHRTTEDYKSWWVTEHDQAWCRRIVDPAEWLRCPYGTDRADRQLARLEEILWPDMVARFNARHATTSVWVLVVEPERVAPDRRIARDGRGDEHGYTTRDDLAVRDIPPAVDEATQRKFSDRGREYDTMRQAGVAEALIDRLRALDTEILNWKHQGQINGFNLRSQVKRLQQARDSIEREIRQQISRRQRAA